MKFFRKRLRKFFRLIDTFDQQRQRFMARAGLNFVHTIDCTQIKRIGSQPVESIGWHTQNFAGANLVCGIANQGAFGSFRIDFDNLDSHTTVLWLLGLSCL